RGTTGAACRNRALHVAQSAGRSPLALARPPTTPSVSPVPASIPEALRARVHAADRGRCAYCRTSEANSGIPLTIDHIQPHAQAGSTVFENLCLACRTCNEFKADTTQAPDPLSGERTPLFHPRRQAWTEHFAWSE